MKFLCRRVPKGLLPFDAVAESELQKLKVGDVVKVEVKKLRNPKHHALYFALVAKIWENVDHRIYPSKANLHEALKFAAGIRETVINPITGEVMEKVGSIAFDEMDQTSFAEFYERICDIVAKHFVPGLESAALMAEIESMIGISSAQAAE